MELEVGVGTEELGDRGLATVEDVTDAPAGGSLGLVDLFEVIDATQNVVVTVADGLTKSDDEILFGEDWAHVLPHGILVPYVSISYP